MLKKWPVGIVPPPISFTTRHLKLNTWLRTLIIVRTVPGVYPVKVPIAPRKRISRFRTLTTVPGTLIVSSPVSLNTLG